MANAHSIIHKQQPYIQAVNVSDIEKTMAVKQNNFDYNMAQVNQAISQFSSIDLARDQDKLHLYQNMKKVLDIVGNTDNIDFSKTGVGSELSTYISKAIDREVIKQAGNTQKIRKFNAKMEEMQQKNPELYNQVNEYDAKHQAGLSQYMNGEKSDIGDLNYTPFKDVEGDLIKRAKELKDLYPSHEVEIENPLKPGYTIKKKVSELSPTEWRLFLGQSMTNHDRAQLAINGRAAYKYNDEEAIKDLNRHRQELETKFNKRIDILRAEIPTVDESRRDKKQKELSLLENEKTRVLSNLDRVGKTAGEIGGYYAEQNMLDPMAAALGREVFLGEGVDEAHFKNLKIAMERQKEMDRRAADREAGLNSTYVLPTPKDTDNIGSGVAIFEEAYDKTVEELRKEMQKVYSEVSSENRLLIDKIEEDIIEENKDANGGEGLTEFELHTLVIDQAEKENLISGEQRISMMSKIDDIKHYARVEEGAEEYVSENMALNKAEEIYDTFTRREKNIIFIDGEEVITFNEHLEREGIDSVEKYKEYATSKDSRKFKYNYALQGAVADGKVEDSYIYKGDGVYEVDNGKIGVSRKGLTELRLAKSLDGTGGRLEDDYDIQKGSKDAMETLSGNIDAEYILTAREGSKFAEDLETTRSAYNKGKKLYNPDLTLGNDNIFNESLKDRDRLYEEGLNLKSAQIPGQNMIVLGGKAGRKEEPLAHLQAREMAAPTANVTVDTPLAVTRREDGGLNILQLTTHKTGDKVGQHWVNAGSIDPGSLTMRNARHILEAIDLEEEQLRMNFIVDAKSKSQNLKYSKGIKSTESLDNIFSKYGEQGDMYISMAAEDTAERYIIDDLNKKGFREKENYKEVENIIKQAKKNSNKFHLELEKGTRSGIVKVVMENKELGNIEIGEVPISPNMDPQLFRDTYYGAPQVYLTQILYEIGLKYTEIDEYEMLGKIKERL